MRFRKIKYDGKEVHLAWSTQGTAEEIEHSLTSADAPEPRLRDALQDFAPEVLKLLELPADYGEGLRITSISLSYDKDGVLGAVVTGLKTLEAANAPLVLNTPHLPEEAKGEGQPELTSRMVELIGAAEGAAQRYINGHRAQANLFAA